MITLPMLWLPIVVSAVFVFIAANILWMALPFWHRPDYRKLPNEDRVIDALADCASGQYAFPSLDWGKATAEQRAAAQSKPGGLLLLRNPGKFSLGTALTLYFLYALLISIFVGYVSRLSLTAGAHYPQVFRVAGTAGILGYSFASISDSIWYGKPWSVTIKQGIDGVIYGLLMAGTFGWLWPR